MWQRLRAWWAGGKTTAPPKPDRHAMSTPSAFARQPLARCHNCDQDTLATYPVQIWGQITVLNMCLECDATKCPRCRAYCARSADLCADCGASLRLRV